MSERDSLLLLIDMLESAQKIKRYTNEFDYEAFLSDDRTVDAVVRNFEIVGEASNRLDQEFRANPDLVNATNHPNQHPCSQRSLRHHPAGGDHRIRIGRSDRNGQRLRPES